MQRLCGPVHETRASSRVASSCSCLRRRASRCRHGVLSCRLSLAPRRFPLLRFPLLSWKTEVTHLSKRHKSVESTTVQGFPTPKKVGVHVYMGVGTQTLLKNEPRKTETVTGDACPRVCSVSGALSAMCHVTNAAICNSVENFLRHLLTNLSDSDGSLP